MIQKLVIVSVNLPLASDLDYGTIPHKHKCLLPDCSILLPGTGRDRVHQDLLQLTSRAGRPRGENRRSKDGRPLESSAQSLSDLRACLLYACCPHIPFHERLGLSRRSMHLRKDLLMGLPPRRRRTACTWPVVPFPARPKIIRDGIAASGACWFRICRFTSREANKRSCFR